MIFAEHHEFCRLLCSFRSEMETAERAAGSSDTWQNIFYNMEGCVCLKKAGGKNGIISIRCKNQQSGKRGVSYDSTDECI